MKYFSIGSIFKNESMILDEWINHYLNRGVDHFYMINDNSDDAYMDVLSKYINKNIITLYQNDVPKIKNRQTISYNNFFKNLNKETQWLAILDIDEFLYSPNEFNLTKILKKYENFAQLEVNWHCFGSSGFKKQPESIIQNFIYRAPTGFKKVAKTPSGYDLCETNGPKCIVNHKFKINKYGIHKSSVSGNTINISWSKMDEPDMIINHYFIMSEEYWQNVKMKRGDADNHFSDNSRDMEYFNIWDINEVEDLVLKNQNLKYNIL